VVLEKIVGGIIAQRGPVRNNVEKGWVLLRIFRVRGVVVSS